MDSTLERLKSAQKCLSAMKTRDFSKCFLKLHTGCSKLLETILQCSLDEELSGEVEKFVAKAISFFETYYSLSYVQRKYVDGEASDATAEAYYDEINDLLLTILCKTQKEKEGAEATDVDSVKRIAATISAQEYALFPIYILLFVLILVLVGY